MITVPTLGVFPSNSADISLKSNSPRNVSVSFVSLSMWMLAKRFDSDVVSRDPRFTLSLYNLDSLVSIVNEAVLVIKSGPTSRH